MGMDIVARRASRMRPEIQFFSFMETISAEVQKNGMGRSANDRESW